MLYATEMLEQTNEQTIDFYVKNYPEVEVVSCDECKADLFLYFLDPQMASSFKQNHHRGMQRVVLSGKAHSSRKRLDAHMGYKCRCGNDSILAEVESGIVPQLKFDKAGQLMNPDQNMDIGPHHAAAVKLVMARDGDLAKTKKLPDSSQSVDGFTTRSLKV